MKEKFVPYSIALLCCVLIFLFIATTERRPNFDKAMDATVAIKRDGGGIIGSGFFFSPEPCIITAYHVVEGEGKIFIKPHKSLKQFESDVIYSYPYLDMAVVCTNKMSRVRPWFTLKHSENVRPGDRVYTIGHPDADKKLLWSVSDGIVSRLSYINDPHETDDGEIWFPQYVMYTNMDVRPGNSGGPLFDDDGYVIGMIVGYHDGPIAHPNGISRAIPGTSLKRFVRHLHKS